MTGARTGTSPRPAARGHVAAGDCERCRPGLVAQPVNTLSSLAYVVSGAAQLQAAGPSGRRSERALAWATVAAGLGSVAYHGPGRRLGRYAHDAALIAMLGYLAVTDAELLLGQELPAPALAAVPVAAALGAHPATAMAAQIVAGTAAGAIEVARAVTTPASAGPTARRSELATLAVGLAAHLGGGTGGPWCRPDARLQPHAVWHAMTAATLWLRATDVARARGNTHPSSRNP